jgi:transcription elongation factor GreB
MSKAFTKEDSGADDGGADDEALEGPAIPKGSKNYITPLGAERLRAELHDLLHVKRPELVKTVQWAAGNGDRSENGDYIYGKRKLREYDRRIRFLTKRLEMAEVVDPVDPKRQGRDRVLFGATVTVVDEAGKSRVYRIVGIDEVDAQAGKVSWLSPVAKALLNARVGDVVTLRTPRGDEELEVSQLEYLAIG